MRQPVATAGRVRAGGGRVCVGGYGRCGVVRARVRSSGAAWRPPMPSIRHTTPVVDERGAIGMGTGNNPPRAARAGARVVEVSRTPSARTRVRVRRRWKCGGGMCESVARA